MQKNQINLLKNLCNSDIINVIIGKSAVLYLTESFKAGFSQKPKGLNAKMKSLRSKLIAATLAISVIIIGVLSAVAITSLNSSTRRDLEETLVPLAEQVAEKIETTVGFQTQMLENSATGKSFTGAENDEQRLEAVKSAVSQDYFLDCAVFDASGRLLKSSGVITEAAQADDTVKKAVSTAEPQLSEVVKTDIFTGYTIAVPVFNGNSAVYVVTVTYDLKAVSDPIKDISFGNEGFVSVIDPEGTIIIDKGDSITDGHNAIELAETDDSYKSEAEFVKNVISERTGYAQFETKDGDYIAAYSNIEGFRGQIVVFSPKDDFFSFLNSGVLYFLIFSVALLVVTVVIIVIFAKTISKPIVNTTQRLRALSQGNLSDPVDVHYSKDELGVLSNSLEETVVSLRQYINLITVALTNISEGNLCHRVEGTFRGDFEKIKSTFNSILESLSDTFASINIAAEQVSNGAVQVSNNAQALSQGSTQQASSIEELSATISDVSDQTTQNAESAKEAYKIVQSNADAIAACNHDMDNMLSAMNEISVSSSEISKIIKVIDEISFQTNILALNAAVEAAREGSKGFGVVADEVRRLASKSAEAAKQTANLIENSVEAISRGSKIAHQTADSLHKIVEDSTEIKKLVKDISDASEHQSEAIVQINTGVDQISAVVAANTSTAVGSASASEELSSQSLILKNMIARFRLTRQENKPATAYGYPTESAVTGGYSYPDGESEPATAASGFVYPDDEPEEQISKYAYPEPEDEEVKIILDDEEEGPFDPESVNDEDDKY